MDEHEKPAPPQEIVVGADVSRLSEEEIMARIAALRAEIIRLEGALEQKQASRMAADAVFRR
ncbi:MAG: DUF1192 domain-containing protein [Xanthobacter sp.]